MISPFETEGAAKRPLRVSLRADQILFLGLMAAIFGVRVANLRYNTLFVDEAIYATVGRNALSGVLNDGALGWMYGSYLYPLLSATIDSVTGEVGLRLVSALLSCLAAVLVYGATRRLFDGESAIWATLFFGLTPISIDIGQYAVYDAPAIPALAASLYLIVRAAAAAPAAARRLLLGAAVCCTLGTLSKYFTALYLPALSCVAVACALRQHRSLTPYLRYFLAPVVVVLCGYAWINHEDLRLLLAGSYGMNSGPRGAIFADIWAEIGLTSLLALAGLALLVPHARALMAGQPRAWRLAWALLVLPLAVSLLAAPLYHLATANQHAAWKHSLFSLIFLAPLAGYTCTSLVTFVRQLPGRGGLAARVAGALLSTALVIWGLDYALNRNQGFQQSWPRTSAVVTHLRTQHLTPGAPILAEGAPIYEYYLNFGAEHQAMWTSTWYANYRGQMGLEAMETAIADRYYQAVILDSYHTPELRERLEAALIAADYQLGFEETQQLSLGFPAQLRVYYAPEHLTLTP